MHIASTYAATLSLSRSDWLATYSERMLACAVLLEEELFENGVSVVRRPNGRPPTQHVWVNEVSRARAFETYEALERCRIFTNYRRLPYSLGVGLRLGLSAAVRIGLQEADIPRLANLIADIRRRARHVLRTEARNFNEMVWGRREDLT